MYIIHVHDCMCIHNSPQRDGAETLALQRIKVQNLGGCVPNSPGLTPMLVVTPRTGTPLMDALISPYGHCTS